MVVCGPVVAVGLQRHYKKHDDVYVRIFMCMPYTLAHMTHYYARGVFVSISIGVCPCLERRWWQLAPEALSCYVQTFPSVRKMEAEVVQMVCELFVSILALCRSLVLCQTPAAARHIVLDLCAHPYAHTHTLTSHS